MHTILGAAVAALCTGNQPDVIFPAYLSPLECLKGCKEPCSIVGNATGKTDGGAATYWAGPACGCAGSDVVGYCRNPLGVPEQINLQLASEDTVVVAFVTYDTEKPVAPPQVKLGLAAAGPFTTVTGVTHWYVESTVTDKDGAHTGRNFSMHFVRLGSLAPRTQYFYSVKGGGANAVWSDTLSFRSLYTAGDGGETRVAIFGDMAITQYNAVGNLASDCASGVIDGIWMMGDHAYDLGMDDDHRGDAYMNGVAVAASRCPWMPIIGNHEASDGDHYNRYLNQTWGEAFANPAVRSSATSAVGHLLSKGTLFGAGSHGSTPSGTSRYFSVDVGLIHFVGLDLNSPETTPRTIGLDTGQIAWLEQDLAAATANRDTVPWIVVTSHFPIYLSSTGLPTSNASAAWYLSDEAESEPIGSGGEFRSCRDNGEVEGCHTVAELREGKAAVLEPLLIKYGVDIYAAGHSHLYGVTWPMINGTATQKNYTTPRGTVYVTEGNGGVPGAPGNHTFNVPAADYMRIGATGGAHGRLITSNSSVLTYEHVYNNGNGGKGKVMETWSIVQPRHSPSFSFA